MSGGVDSSVSALLTSEMGYECIGCTMRLYDAEDSDLQAESTCCSLSDVEDARSVAHSLGMPYYVFNFSHDFSEKVIRRFIDSYLHGITPNPCIDCNRYMKFDQLYLKGKVLGCDSIVTGHYARIDQKDGKYRLLKALDDTKDQSYVLYTMTQEQLSHTIFPLGTLRKTEVRKIAEEHGFINSDKPDSQDICFVPDGDYAAMIERTTGKQSAPGNFVDPDGNVLGTHSGIIHYTIGQHRGLGISLGKCMYVCSINPDENTVTLGDREALFCTEAIVGDFNWISGVTPTAPFRCKAKTRYRHQEQPAEIIPLENGNIRIHFDEPQRAITPGQAAVLYDGDCVLGGGRILTFQK